MAKNPDIYYVEINFNGREIRKTLEPALEYGQEIDLWDEDLERTSKQWKKHALVLDDYVTNVYETTDGKPYQDVVIKALLDIARVHTGDEYLYCQKYICIHNYSELL